MAAIVGIDAAILIAPIASTRFNNGTGGAVQADELPTWNPTTKIWSWANPHAIADTKTVTPINVAGTTTLSAAGTYTGARNSIFEVIISVNGTPDSFKWRRDGGAWSADTAITGSAQTLADGLTVTFSSTANALLNDSWLVTVTYSPWDELPERNEASLNISVDIAEHKPFVASLSDAWVDKARTWMNWSGSFSGFYDDLQDNIFVNMKAGLAVWMIMFDSRYVAVTGTPTDYWFGKILLTSVDHTTGSEDFSTLDVDFEGLGQLYRSAVA